MRDRIFSSVLLPAPFRPMMPTTSPGATLNDTSFSAQMQRRRGRSAEAAAGGPPDSRRHDAAAASESVSRSEPYVNAPRIAPRR